MNHKKRVEAVLRGETPDQIPVLPAATFATASLQGISVKAARNDAELMATCLIEGQIKAKSDGIYTGWESSFNLMAEALGCTLSTPENDVPAVEKPLFATGEADPDRVRPELVDTDPTLALHAQVTRLVRKKVGSDYLIFAYVPGPFTVAGLLLGPERLLLECTENPDLVAVMANRTTLAGQRFATGRARAGADVLVIADPLASATVISPRMFRRFAKYPLTRLCTHIKKELAKVPSLHICGHTTSILQDMAETGAKILELDHAVDLAVANEKLPQDLVIQGNLDPALLLSGPVATIREKAAACLAACAGRPFILSTGCEVALRTPLENYLALTESVVDSKP